MPETIKDEWIEDIESQGEIMDQYIQDHRRATGFDLRYNASMKRTEHQWRDGLFAGVVAAGFCQFDARRVALIVVLVFFRAFCDTL